MRFIIFNLVIFTSIVCAQTSIAFESESQLRSLFSQPTTIQNIDVNVVECTYTHTFSGEM